MSKQIVSIQPGLVEDAKYIPVNGLDHADSRHSSTPKSDSIDDLDALAWADQFAASKDVLENLFDEIVEEYRSGRTIPIG